MKHACLTSIPTQLTLIYGNMCKYEYLYVDMSCRGTQDYNYYNSLFGEYEESVPVRLSGNSEDTTRQPADTPAGKSHSPVKWPPNAGEHVDEMSHRSSESRTPGCKLHRGASFLFHLYVTLTATVIISLQAFKQTVCQRQNLLPTSFWILKSARWWLHLNNRV